MVERSAYSQLKSLSMLCVYIDIDVIAHVERDKEKQKQNDTDSEFVKSTNHRKVHSQPAPVLTIEKRKFLTYIT